MKFEFSNLGAIKHTELDLRPLTVIIGPNNSNKTYLASCVYGLLWALRRNSDMWGNLKPPLSIEELYSLLQERLITSTLAFNQSLGTFFQDYSKHLFTHSTIKPLDLAISSQSFHSLVVEQLHAFPITIGGQQSIRLTDNEKAIEVSKKIKDEDIFLVVLVFCNLICDSLFPRPFILPSERNAMMISYRMLSDRRYRLLRDQKSDGGVRYPKPVEDFLDHLTDFELHTNGDFQQSPVFLEIDALIEKHLNKNHKLQYRSTTTGGRELYLQVGKNLQVDLYNASSSIKQLAPLLLYLRYRAKENDLLIIDEPEMNLHPESQLKLLEILAILVNAGVKVLLTTHSPYIMAHLNNLMQSEEKPEEIRKLQAKSLYVKDSRAFLKPEQISAYEMTPQQEGRETHYELHSLKDPDYGIRWGTLSEVAEDVQEKYFEIYEAGKTQKRKSTRVSRSTPTKTESPR